MLAGKCQTGEFVDSQAEKIGVYVECVTDQRNSAHFEDYIHLVDHIGKDYFGGLVEYRTGKYSE
jgi:hypothetical protein